jgi:hypothetical protein
MYWQKEIIKLKNELKTKEIEIVKILANVRQLYPNIGYQGKYAAFTKELLLMLTKLDCAMIVING